VPELAIAPVAAVLEPAIVLVAELEPAIVLVEVVRPTVPAAEATVLAVAAPAIVSVATMFLGAAVPAGVVPLAVVVG
jgi:hypothetical protein